MRRRDPGSEVTNQGSDSSRQAPGLDPFLYGPVTLSADQVGPFSSDLGHGLHEAGSSVEEADAVVGGVPVWQHAVGDELLEQWATLGFGVVVDSI